MILKYLGLNKLCTVGFLIFICLLFVCKYLEVVHLRNKLLIFDEDDEDYEYSNIETHINATKSNARHILDVKELVKNRNNQQLVRNMYHERVFRQGTTFIVVEVRSNTFYLEGLIKSLRNVVGIVNSLLIFSHEVYDENIDEIIRNISFAKYIQIYYPYSVQLYPKTFPGMDSKFCVHDFNCDDNNGQRNATAVQIKHHWWWRTSFVFDHLKVTKNFNGTIVFLEEDQCVTADFVYILKMLERFRSNSCPHCEILSLGASYPVISHYHIMNATMVVDTLGSTEELMGIAFNRSVWDSIKTLSEPFCDFNDVDWIRSLVYASTKTPSGKYFVLSIEGPRVFRFSRCPYEGVECGDLDKVDAAQSFMNKINRGLFPRIMSLKVHNKHFNGSTGRGGWIDARDRELCKYTTRKDRFQ